MMLSCQQNESANHDVFLTSKITVKGDKFVDNHGRQIILNGLNIVNKSKEQGYIPSGGTELYKKLKKWGFNCIRFAIIWDRLEPRPGEYNEEYLIEIDQQIAWARENNIYVVLDMHQDLFSVKYSDGAPEWATLDEGKAHTTGAIWSDAYMMSEAVQTSFDNFWANKTVKDGIGLQDHYASLWQHIAGRYSDNSTVIGYDIMNEPFPGSAALEATMILLQAYGALNYSLTGELLNEDQLIEMWSDEERRTQALHMLSNEENYHQVVSQLFELNSQFEITQLQPFYQKVSNAIREVDNEHILYLEHSYYSNTGVDSSIERVSLVDGSPDPLVAYAPHGYDLVTDTEAVSSASNERVTYIYNQIKSKGAQLKMPVWLGEWGAFYNNSESVVPVANSAIRLIETHLFGNAYWSYHTEIENLTYFKDVLIRPFPSATNGTLISYTNDFETSRFTMSWKESENELAPTLIFVPRISKIKKESLKNLGKIHIKTFQDSDAGFLLIPPIKKNKERTLTLYFED